MIKNFENFVSDKNTVNEGRYGSARGLVAIDLDDKREGDYTIYELEDYETSRGWDSIDEVEASIYVMPDDTVEIRSIDITPWCIRAVFSQITGKDVRNEDLHRHHWVLSYSGDE